MVGATWYVGWTLGAPAWVELVVMIGTGGVVYAATVLALDLGTGWGMRTTLRRLATSVVN
jgi:hypothetical protein